MKNLQSFGVQELNPKEIKQLNGGYWFLSAMAGSFLYGVIEDWEGNVAAFNSARNRAN
jgi:hypothetical protein|tara:strand:+ start:207 stop:380 length:174 start_codon:yes stop_codon:yes gene_type:complete